MDDPMFLSWVREVTIQTIDAMFEAEVAVGFQRVEFSGLPVLHKLDPHITYWYDYSPRDRIVQSLQGPLLPQYRRTKVLSGGGFDTCFDHLFFGDEDDGGSSPVPFWEREHLPFGQNVSAFKSARATPYGSSWRDVLYPWSSGRNAFNLHAIVRLVRKIGRTGPGVVIGNLPLPNLIALLCFAIFRKSIPLPSDKEVRTYVYPTELSTTLNANHHLHRYRNNQFRNGFEQPYSLDTR